MTGREVAVTRDDLERTVWAMLKDAGLDSVVRLLRTAMMDRDAELAAVRADLETASGVIEQQANRPEPPRIDAAQLETALEMTRQNRDALQARVVAVRAALAEAGLGVPGRPDLGDGDSPEAIRRWTIALGMIRAAVDPACEAPDVLRYNATVREGEEWVKRRGWSEDASRGSLPNRWVKGDSDKRHSLQEALAREGFRYD